MCIIYKYKYSQGNLQVYEFQTNCSYILCHQEFPDGVGGIPIEC